MESGNEMGNRRSTKSALRRELAKLVSASGLYHNGCSFCGSDDLDLKDVRVETSLVTNVSMVRILVICKECRQIDAYMVSTIELAKAAVLLG
jgi:hypothetical protein